MQPALFILAGAQLRLFAPAPPGVSPLSAQSAASRPAWSLRGAASAGELGPAPQAHPAPRWIPRAAGLVLPALPLAALAEDPAAGGWLQSKEFHDLAIYLAQTVISWGVPAAVLGFIAIQIASATSKKEGGADEAQNLPPALKKALGIQDESEPKEYLEIERLNSKLDSYAYSFRKASISRASALRVRGRAEIERQFGAEFAAFGLDGQTLDKVLKIATEYRKSEQRLTKRVETLLIDLRAGGLTQQPTKVGENDTTDDADADAENSGGPFAFMKGMGNPMGGGNQAVVMKLQQERLALELKFLRDLSEILSSDQAAALAKVLKPSAPGLDGARLGGRADALGALVTTATEAAGKAKHVFVLKFFGDVTASQVAQLRQEVTAVLRSADVEGRGDEVVLVLNTGGGTVTGYGLAAAQLQRLKDAKLPLTICVEQVAASGGYLMACVADEIVASPFAVLGSIGVITEQPNVYERLKTEGIQFSTITAGKYKRTLVPTKKIDQADVAKLKEDISQVLAIFKGFVEKHRPALNIEEVATGETWIGPDALAKNLVDRLATVDDVLLRYVDAGAEVFGVKYKEKKSPLAALSGAGASAPLQALALDWLLRTTGGGARERLENLRSLQRTERGAGSALLQRPDEPELLAARPSDLAEPMLLWGEGSPGSATSDSWDF